ncbi:helix-turn-helix domain-containing protein [Streptomyces sp. H39-S7]|uniref:helix-turn-helix domain-containing protein n=1 Tax=Streptomyces sp. H39-S7 TaxID=3004357 RepID=UPI0022B06254|nr:helix-turn-helix transcriptional regulator [Streptomyces sp. H39-S7]MCZ4122222.1 helix-turn-helix transcriptional regulator [Streptomyces sp. H39-S7]
MGLRSNPSQRQRRLGAELRRLRELSGMSATDAGALAGLGRAHMSHIEMGRTAIPEEKLRALADAYGCNSRTLVDALVEMGQATGKGWWTEFRDSHSAPALDLAEIEADCTAHRSFEWVFVQGLLQTPEYMRALFEIGNRDAGSDELDRAVDFRLRRQQILKGGSRRRLHMVIHEAALHMQFVGADIMRHQIEHLVELARLPDIRIQILPFSAQTYPAAFGTPFALFDSVAPELGTVYVEHPVAPLFLGEPDHLTEFTDAFERLSTVALPPLDPEPESKFYARRDSLGLVQHLLYRM